MTKKTFSLGSETAQLLEDLASRFYANNQTEVVRVAVHALAAQHGLGETTWTVDGYVAGRAPSVGDQCYRCESRFQAGALLYRPVFRCGAVPKAASRSGSEAFPRLPEEELWVCPACVEEEG